MKPLISVIMPVYNAEKYLALAIESILNQTYTNFEYILIFDISNDKTKEIILSFQDQRIRFIENSERLNMVKSLNVGLTLAKGKYIARMDADDIALPMRLEKQIKYMESNPMIGVCGSWFESIENVHSSICRYETQHDRIRIKMLNTMELFHPSLVIRKEIIDKYKFRYSNDFIFAEDYDLFVRMSEVTQVANIPEVLMRYRIHAESSSTVNKNIYQSYIQKVILYQFNRIGIDVDENDILLYKRFCNAEFNLSWEEIIKLESLLTGIIKSNNKSTYLNPPILSVYLSEKWFHSCYNLSRKHKKKIFDLYCRSSLSKFYKIKKKIG